MVTQQLNINIPQETLLKLSVDMHTYQEGRDHSLLIYYIWYYIIYTLI